MLLMMNLVLAGKLAAGWRGVPYGDGAWLEKPPSAECIANPETAVRWRCPEDVAGKTVLVNYMVERGLYTGIAIRCDGYDACGTLQKTLVAAWGTCTQKNKYDSGPLPECSWLDAGTFGTWEYNRFSTVGTAIAVHMATYQKVKSMDEADAAKAAGGL
jgi:hypothetical protein